MKTLILTLLLAGVALASFAQAKKDTVKQDTSGVFAITKQSAITLYQAIETFKKMLPDADHVSAKEAYDASSFLDRLQKMIYQRYVPQSGNK
jgi:hypothetical protein